MEHKDKPRNAEPSTLSRASPENTAMRLTGKKRLLEEGNQDSRDSPVERRKCPDGASSNLTEAESVVNLFRASTPLSVEATIESDLIDLTQSDNDEGPSESPMTNGVQSSLRSPDEATGAAAAEQTANGSGQAGDFGTGSVETSPVGISTLSPASDTTNATSDSNSDCNSCGVQSRDSVVQSSAHPHCLCCSRSAPHTVSNYWPVHHCAVHNPLNIRYMNVHHFHQHFHGEPAVTYPMSNANYARASRDPSRALQPSSPFERAPPRAAQLITPSNFPSYVARYAPRAFRPRNGSSSSRDRPGNPHAITTVSRPAVSLRCPHSHFDIVEQRSRVSPSTEQTGASTADRPGPGATDGSSGSSAQSGGSFLDGFVFLSDSSDDDEPLAPYETYIRALIHSPVPLWQQRQLEGQQGHLERRRRVESQWFDYWEQMDTSSGYRIPPISFNRGAGQQLTQPVVSRPDASNGDRACTGNSGTGIRPSVRRGIPTLPNIRVPAFMSRLGSAPSHVESNASQAAAAAAQNRSDSEPAQQSGGRSSNESTDGRSLYPHPSTFLGPFVLLDRQSWPMEAQLLRHMAQILETPEGATMTVIERHTVCSRFVPSDDGEEDKCSICLVEFGREESIRTLRCNHFFHVRCIDRWLVINKKCPVCRLEVDRV